MNGQRMTGAVCPDCKSKLPPLIDENGGWGIVDCQTDGCNKWFDTYRYEKAGGKLVLNN